MAPTPTTHTTAGIPIGAHAIGLGGAFTGVADDASATYFNPAGSTLGGNFGLAAGLSVNAWERFDLKRAFDQPDGLASATTKTNRSVPIFVGAGFKFRPQDAYGDKEYAVGLSVVEPIFFAGGEFDIHRRVTIQAGFFTDFSSAAKIPDNPDRYYIPRINRLGGTLSLGVHASGISLAVGSTFIYGRGDATGVVLDVNNLGLGYTRTEASSRVVYLHLTGVTRAAEQIGKKLQRKVGSGSEPGQ